MALDPERCAVPEFVQELQRDSGGRDSGGRAALCHLSDIQ